MIRSLDPAGGGVAEGVRQLSQHLASLGTSSTLVSLDPPGAPWLTTEPQPSYGLGPVLGTYGYQRGVVRQLQTLAHDHDAVLIHGLWQYHALATWRALRGSTTPYGVYPHGMLDPWFRRRYPIKHLKKWAYWPWADYRVLADANAVFFTTEAERLLARESFWLYRAREQVVGLGVSAPPGDPVEQRKSFRDAFPQLHQRQLLLFLGRLHPKKGLDLLIEAFARVLPLAPHLHLLIAGPDQVGWQATLEQQARHLGVDHAITWAGMLQGDLKWGAFRSADLFCLPSHQENFGIAVAEALACGLPVAIAEPVNLAPTVRSAGAGLVHPDTVDGTEQALRTWLCSSATERLHMARQGLTLFQQELHGRACATRLLHHLQQAIDHPSQLHSTHTPATDPVSSHGLTHREPDQRSHRQAQRP